MKVKPQDLRLGNLILHELFGAVEVIAIYKNSYDVTRDGKTKEWFAGLGCKGIPLTEEWLLRAGAKRFGKDFTLHGIIIHSRKRGFVINKSVPIMEYLHQLQNFIFANRGKELEFKL